MKSISNDVTTMNGLCYEVPFGFFEGDTNLPLIYLKGLYENTYSADQFTDPDAAKFNQTIKYGLSMSGMAVKYFGQDVGLLIF